MTDHSPNDAPQKRKPGFFSRLFTVTKVTEEAEEAEQLEQALEAAPPALEEVPAGEEKKAPGWKRWFTREKQPAEAEIEKAPTPAPIIPQPSPEQRRNWFQRLTDRLDKTRRSLVDNVRTILKLSGRLDEETVEEIEAALIMNDVAVETTEKIIRRMKAEAKSREREMGPDGLLDVFKESIRDILTNAAPGFEPKTPPDGSPYVVMVIGVNGAGKTTTIAKMAKRCTSAGLKTMLVAGDTFRAAAVEQLEIWAQRTGSDFARGPKEMDPAALCFDALQRAKARGTQVVFIDTAGRLHTKSSLMDELTKIERIVDRQVPGAPHEILLVLDATTGQNAIQQVKIFAEAVKVSGLIMTKLDGTAKGGVLLSILDQYHIPITLIGVGESADDLRDFDPDLFAKALFGEA